MHALVFLCLAYQFNDHKLRWIVDPPRETTVSQSTAEYHGGFFVGVDSGIILRKQFVAGADEATAVHTDLTTVVMTAKSQVNAVSLVYI